MKRQTEMHPTEAPTLTPGQQRVHAERTRQKEEERWTAAGDDRYVDGELARAATAYLTGTQGLWPWNLTYWKPKSPQRNLEKAGALYLAEAERLERHLAAVPEKQFAPGYADSIRLAIAEAYGRADFCGHLLDVLSTGSFAPVIIAIH